MDDRIGRVEVIAGPMFAGKTEELLRRVRRAAIAGRRVQVISHAIDTRGGSDVVRSHVGLDHPAVGAATAAELEAAVDPGADLVAIDEAQFFGEALVDVIGRLAAAGRVVVVAGLDVTFEGAPFPPMPSLMALAESVDKLTAICALCGEEAIYHVRLGDSAGARRATELVAEHVGGLEKYQARCRRHVRAETERAGG